MCKYQHLKQRRDLLKSRLVIPMSSMGTCTSDALSFGFDTYVQIITHRYVSIRVTYNDSKFLLSWRNVIYCRRFNCGTSTKKSIDTKPRKKTHMLITLTDKTFLAYDWRHLLTTNNWVLKLSIWKPFLTGINGRYRC